MRISLLFDKRIRYHIKDITKECKSIINEYFTYSVPVIISDMLLAFGNNAVAVIMGRIGSNFVSANAIISVTVQFITVANLGLTTQAVSLQEILWVKERWIKPIGKVLPSFALSAILGCIASVIIIIITPYIIGLYNITDETVRIAKELMMAVAINVIFASIASVMTKGSSFEEGGDTRFLMIADILFLWIASVPLGTSDGGLVFRLSPLVLFIPV